MGTTRGQDLWRKAKTVIAGGNSLLSKRPDMHLPKKWPCYFSKAKGCLVWDIDGNSYKDMGIMGIGTNILGYGNTAVDEAVIDAVRRGNMSTLNCSEEVELAEKLVNLHPWSDMAKFARSGGEANSIAIRIARAATGREKVAVCGYHGWHDWYLATGLQNISGLEEHLIKGLEPNGVPQSLKGSSIPFSYNKLEQLKDIVRQHDLAAVKMEVQRSTPPIIGFLEGVRELCNKNGIVLIFDECTSGFRECLGGIHLKYKVDPDIAIFGKALGNGYAISSVIGKENVMDYAQNTFISSTFWTERIGPTAALKTLEEMEKEKSWEKITEKGKFITKRWIDLANQLDISIKTNGLPAITSFGFNSNYELEYKTLITQEMLKKGFLASNLLFVSTAHTNGVINEYFDKLYDVFKLIKNCQTKKSVLQSLEGPVCHSGFKRLN